LSICPACTDLDGRTSSLKPHPSLVPSEVRTVGTVKREIFRCAACQALLERPLPHGHSVKPGFWTFMGGQPVARP
jgi:hypothetical protein